MKNKISQRRFTAANAIKYIFVDNVLIRLFANTIIENVLANKPNIHVITDDHPPTINKIINTKFSSSLVHENLIVLFNGITIIS
jgi:hypothetical protein